MPSIFSPVLSETAITDLPQWVYDDIANPAVSQIDVPWGRYNLPIQNAIHRSNLTIDGHGSTFVLQGSLGGYHFYIYSVVDAVTGKPGNRDYSHLQGQIYQATTTLTMTEDEVEDVQAGEYVTVRCGVSPTDPAEPARYLIKQIESVSDRVITFSTPFGIDVTVYADEDALKAVAPPSQWEKIAPWGELSAALRPGQGLGLDHGMYRYTGGLNHDITFKNLHFEVVMPADADLVTSLGTTFFIRDIVNFTLENVTGCNCVNAFLHSWRSDNVLVDNLTFSGVGRMKIFAPSTVSPGCLITAWGGTGLTYRNINVMGGQNLALANMEVAPGDVLLKNINFTMDFRKNYNYGAAVTLLGFYGTIYPAGAVLEDLTLKIAADSLQTWNFDANNTYNFTNLTFDSTTFPTYFAFNRHLITGTVTVDGVAYGPLTSRSDTVVRTATANLNHIAPPKGFYKSLLYRVTSAGACVAISDGYGNTVTAPLTSGEWTSVNSSWFIPTPLTAISTIQGKNRFGLWWSPVGGASLTMEFQVEYFPAPDDAGWTTD